MLLAIDAGNTNVSFALFKDKDIMHSWRASSNIHRTADEWAAWLTHLFELQGLSLQDISGVMMASVVPEILSHLRLFCEKYVSQPFWVVGERKTDFGIQALIDRPGEEGVDLMVNAVAAHALFRGPLMVIDFGTATTFSCVNHQGHFCGVAIAPGVHLSLQALYQGAASLPRVGIRQPARVIGKNTVESMQSGIFWGYLSMVEGMITRIHAEQRKQYAEHEEQTELKVIATGGLGRLFARETPLIHHYEPDLTLRGLQIIYERLKNQASIQKNQGPIQ